MANITYCPVCKGYKPHDPHHIHDWSQVWCDKHSADEELFKLTMKLEAASRDLRAQQQFSEALDKAFEVRMLARTQDVTE